MAALTPSSIAPVQIEFRTRGTMGWIKATKTNEGIKMPSVARAVDELLPDRDIMGKGRVWVWRKGALRDRRLDPPGPG